MEMPTAIADERRRGRVARNLKSIPWGIREKKGEGVEVRRLFRRMISYTWTDAEFNVIERDLKAATLAWLHEEFEED